MKEGGLARPACASPWNPVAKLLTLEVSGRRSLCLSNLVVAWVYRGGPYESEF
jgi:hypothetical protein